jgi:hypothetical protein
MRADAVAGFGSGIGPKATTGAGFTKHTSKNFPVYPSD